MRAFLRMHKRVAIPIVVSFLAVLIVLFVWNVPSLLTDRISPPPLPQLPDLTGEPAVLAEYLRSMNDQALKSPSSSDVVGALAMAYQSNFYYDEAQVCNERAAALNPREWRWIYYSALMDEELGNTKGTIDKLDRVLELDPDVAQAWFRLGNSYLKTNQYQDAEKAFRQVLTRMEFVPRTSGDVELSNTGAFPLKAYASFNLARTEFLQNRSGEAKTILEELLGQYPAFGPAYRLLGDVYRKSGDGVKGAELDIRAGDFESYVPPADPLYDQLILSSRNKAFLIKQLDIAAKSKTSQWTLTLMDRLTALDPNDAEILTKRMKLALDMQMLHTVDSLLPSFVRLCGTDEMKLMDMAKYFVYRGQFEPAVMLLRKAIGINQRSIDAHLLFIDILTQFKQYDMGISYCKEIVAMDPRNAELRIRLARLYIERGDTQEAKRQIQIAQNLSPNAEVSFVMLGRIARKEGSEQNALAYYRKALAANPRGVNTQLEVGGYLVDLRKWADAFSLFQSSLKTSPNDLDLLERYAWTLAVCPLQESGNAEKALEVAKRLVLRRKYTKDQEMRCGVTLAAAYARVNDFDQAVATAEKYLGYAGTMRQTSYLRRLQDMIAMFREHKPYSL